MYRNTCESAKVTESRFYYELVRRRYSGTEYADQATRRMQELLGKPEKE
jgi:hypothetical protein